MKLSFAGVLFLGVLKKTFATFDVSGILGEGFCS